LIKLLNQSNEYFLKPDSCMYWNRFLSCCVMKLTLAYCHLLWKRILDIHPSCLISRHAFDLLCWNRDQMVLLNTLVFSSPFDYRRLQWHLPLQPLSLPESNSIFANRFLCKKINFARLIMSGYCVHDTWYIMPFTIYIFLFIKSWGTVLSKMRNGAGWTWNDNIGVFKRTSWAFLFLWWAWTWWYAWIRNCCYGKLSSKKWVISRSVYVLFDAGNR